MINQVEDNFCDHTAPLDAYNMNELVGFVTEESPGSSLILRQPLDVAQLI